jgi:GDP-D-mannose dehydratase
MEIQTEIILFDFDDKSSVMKIADVQDVDTEEVYNLSDESDVSTEHFITEDQK